jgi:transposase
VRRRQLSRIPLSGRRMAESRAVGTAYWVYHERSSSCWRERGAGCRATWAGGLAAASGSGSGAGDIAVARRVVKRPDFPGLWRGASHGTAVALDIRGRGGGGIARAHGLRTGACKGARRLVGGLGGTVGCGCGSAELDVASATKRDRTTNWRIDFEITAQRGDAEKRGLRWRRPRHTLRGRQDPAAVDRSGLRLKLLKQQAEAGDITLLFGDESEALTHPYLAHAWAKRGADLRVAAPGQAKKVAMVGVLDFAERRLVVETSRTKRSSDFVALLDNLDQRYGPRPDRAAKPVVLVLDNGPIHTSKLSTAALAARSWLTIEWLPKYAPELNDIENAWRDLKRHFLAHLTFTSPEHLDQVIHREIAAMNLERAANPSVNLRIAA